MLVLVEDVADTSEESGQQILVYLLIAAGYFALWLVPGLKGNKWREIKLMKRGFKLLGIVDADTADAGVAYFARAT